MCKSFPNEKKCCCCPLRIGVHIYFVWLLLGTFACFFDIKVGWLILVVNVPRLITLTLVLFFK